MKYIDEQGKPLDRVDLSLGRLEDAEWVDHPEVQEVGHYKYEPLDGGGQLQRYVIDTPYQAAWREVTVQRYIRYTPEELEAIAAGDYAARLNALEAASSAQSDTNALLSAQVQAVSDRGDFVEDCIAEMAAIVYA